MAPSPSSISQSSSSSSKKVIKAAPKEKCGGPKKWKPTAAQQLLILKHCYNVGVHIPAHGKTFEKWKEVIQNLFREETMAHLRGHGNGRCR